MSESNPEMYIYNQFEIISNENADVRWDEFIAQHTSPHSLISRLPDDIISIIDDIYKSYYLTCYNIDDMSERINGNYWKLQTKHKYLIYRRNESPFNQILIKTSDSGNICIEIRSDIIVIHINAIDGVRRRPMLDKYPFTVADKLPYDFDYIRSDNIVYQHENDYYKPIEPIYGESRTILFNHDAPQFNNNISGLIDIYTGKLCPGCKGTKYWSCSWLRIVILEYYLASKYNIGITQIRDPARIAKCVCEDCHDITNIPRFLYICIDKNI